MSTTSTDVVIVGAGPTGLMAAALLARCGIRVRLLEKNQGPTEESRAFGVHAKSMELFLNMGIVERFLERGLVATGAQIFVEGSKAGELNFDDIGRADTPYSFFFMVPQSVIEKLLADDVRERGVEIEYGTEVTGFEQSEKGVVTTVRNSQLSEVSDNQSESSTIESSYIIGADGAHSCVRKVMGLTFAGAPYPQGFFLADCKIDWPLDYEHMKLFLNEQHFAVYLPLKGRELCRVICIRPVDDGEVPESTEATTSAPLTLQEVQDAFQKATCMDVKLHDPGWIARYRIHHRGVNHYREGRAFVAGDAAHIHSPAGGQGMNTGLQDAANLAWKIALCLKGKENSDLLDSYHNERWPVGRKVLKYTDEVFANMTSQTGWKAHIRDTLVPLLAGTMSKSGLVRARLFHFMSQLGIKYHGEEFLVDQHRESSPKSWRDGLTPGHRAPNALVTRDLDVFSFAKGYSFHLLVLSMTALGNEEIAEISRQLESLPNNIGMPLEKHFISHSLLGRDSRIVRVECSQIFHAYGVTHEIPQAMFLIRPDGHIAYRADHLDFDALRQYLKRLMPL